ncbi:sulfotransferase family protein [Coleofasciculus sp. E2-BRE-01]|uniref:sulfotransferase family protein n=1 Tax=Coleofasciculus sp. E2-BRE-01 TaxID=3069524 RepID=UPI003302F437
MSHHSIQHSPIFLLGVGRSGTTLLRMMLDSHPEIMCGSEAPWITNQVIDGFPSLRELTQYLIKHKWGPVNGLTGVNEDIIYQQMALFIDGIMSTAAQSYGKTRWADKTPRNIIAVPFLYRLFPHAKFIHLFRDGRDVALSTKAAPWKTIPYRSNKVKNTYGNALKRWVDWIETFHIDAKALKLTYLPVRYEDLVCSPKSEIQKILDFIEVEWSDQVLNPYKFEHDTVEGEGRKSFYLRQSIDTQALYRWKKELNWFERRSTKAIGEETLLKLGYESTESAKI